MSVRPPRISPLGREINLLQTQSFRLAAEKALKAFLEPPRRNPTSNQHSVLGTAKKSTVLVDGKAVVTYTWARTSNARTVLLSHGYGTNAAALVNFVQPLLDAGLRVIAWDQTGHGESDGDWGDLRIFINTFQTLALRNAPLAAAICHSVSATMAIIALIENPLIICPRLACISPPTQMDTLLATFLRSQGCSTNLASPMQDIIAESKIISPTLVRSVLPSQKLQTRMFIVQDRDDTIVPVTDAEWLAGAVPGSRLEMTQGSGHYNVLENAPLVRMVTDFVVNGDAGHLGGDSKL